MNILFFDDTSHDNLLPLTFTRPVSELRVGIHTIRGKWSCFFPEATFSNITKQYLKDKYPANYQEVNYLICGGLLPEISLVETIRKLEMNECLLLNGRPVACCLNKKRAESFDPANLNDLRCTEYSAGLSILDHPWQIFGWNGQEIRKDFDLITSAKQSHSLSDTNRIAGNELFVEEGVKADFSIINTTSGPVYLGKGSEIMEGSIIRGPFALCEGSVVKMGAKIYGPTTIGPWSKVGGEVNNSVILGYSNKAHDGFLGNSVIGEWCNLGADTNNSNLKNNYAEVRLWSYPEERFINTGLQFCGLIMGDHSKCGINCMFNTGTVVGVNSNIFGSGFPRNFIPSFSWGGAQGFTTFSLSKAFEVAGKVMERRGIDFDEKERNILREVFKMTEKYRK